MKSVGFVLMALGASSFIFHALGKQSLIMGVFGAQEHIAAYAAIGVGLALFLIGFKMKKKEEKK